MNSKPNWYLELNPEGNIPLLQYKNKTLSESLVCMEYLQEEFGRYSYLSTKPIERAHQRSLMIRFGKITSAFSAFLDPRDAAEQSKNHTFILENLAFFEVELFEPFFSGNLKLYKNTAYLINKLKFCFIEKIRISTIK